MRETRQSLWTMYLGMPVGTVQHNKRTTNTQMVLGQPKCGYCSTLHFHSSRAGHSHYIINEYYHYYRSLHINVITDNIAHNTPRILNLHKSHSIILTHNIFVIITHIMELHNGSLNRIQISIYIKTLG